MTDSPKTHYLKDYAPPNFMVKTVDLTVDIGRDRTTVRARLRLRRRGGGDLELNGRGLELLRIAADGRELREGEYRLTDGGMSVRPPADQFELEILTRIDPLGNAALEGLYVSNDIYCTQCEAEGFRRITYFPDRPDVMAVFTTRIEADRERFPVLLANGNLVRSGELPGNRHFVVWHDPFPKPCYLFAMVAGDLAAVKDSFTTRSGRLIDLEIYVEHHNSDKCAHAMRSLRKAMRWDEERFGLEYDLDRYMIVAVDDFNAGAMENKGLNIFNSKYILARPETATDADYEGIEAVVAHEYFHNWTGNRVTCRDWFQLSLKEGLTVFRDQEFSADVGSRAVKRISDVTLLRTHQFPEDAGPMAHPVRPESYIEINNFYTLTVYEKGAEVIRMLQTILGRDLFVKGLDLYLSRHDGQAVTTDDFVQAMADILAYNHRPEEADRLEIFKRWYRTPGTPRLKVRSVHDPEAATLTLEVAQEPPSVAPEAEPLYIPLAVGLLAPDGTEIPLRCRELPSAGGEDTTLVLPVTGRTGIFTFTGVDEAPVVSLLRGFSAPVTLDFDYGEDELYFLMAHDPDPFSRWEAGQRVFVSVLLRAVEAVRAGVEPEVDGRLLDFFRLVLRGRFDGDRMFRAQMLTLPAESYLAEQMDEVDVEAVHAARETLRRIVGGRLRRELRAAYEEHLDSGPYRYEAKLAGRRRFKNLCLSYLMAAPDAAASALCRRQFDAGANMTDELAALQALVLARDEGAGDALAVFYQKWKDEPLVVDKWFAIQAAVPAAATLERVRELMGHERFSIRNPNKVRALIGTFAATPVCFHAADGQGYRFVTDRVLEIDAFNPNIAARLLGRFSRWRRYDGRRRALMRAELERCLNHPGLSKGCYEVAEKCLAPAAGKSS